MRYAILSDIHSNLEALDAVLEDIGNLKENGEEFKTICLGDIVGYGANPNEVIEKVREFDVVIMGNHDEVVFMPFKADVFNVWAKDSAEWTRGQLTEENHRWLIKLPYIHTSDTGNVLFVHGSPDWPEGFKYILSNVDAAEAFEVWPSSNNDHAVVIAFIGHTHVPTVWYEDFTDMMPDGNNAVTTLDLTSLNSKRRVIIDVGSVGQPRDGQTRASYAVYNRDAQTLQWRRIEYDIDKAAGKIRDAGLPEKLANRLFKGR
jgi:diadenosine tetraphosphatase ApaH/serine/threonine PP2A family protein phosphatase